MSQSGSSTSGGAGFSTEKYVELQREAIMERLGKTDGRLYLEVS